MSGAAPARALWSAPTGVLLLNLGTPDAPTARAVRRYLREFLGDPRVIDLPGWQRWLLLNLIILPVRPRRSAEAYGKVWTAAGSPLLVHGRALAAALQERLGAGFVVALGMRYGRPSIGAALDQLEAAGVGRIVCLPLFPQQASSSTGSALAELYRLAALRENVPPLEVRPPFYDHPAFIRALAAVTGPALAAFRPDKLLLSFHGLPERHVRASDPTGAHCLAAPGCSGALVAANRACYRAHCYATARGLTAALGLPPERWEVAFQSRLGRTPWIRPFTDERLRELPAEGVRRLAVVVPSFVADCLETLEEIGIRGRAEFLAAGGEELLLVPCLNAHEAWVEAVAEIVGVATPPAAG